MKRRKQIDGFNHFYFRVLVVTSILVFRGGCLIADYAFVVDVLCMLL